jgi:V/A-type H+-transporting ATPase subunit D
MSRRDAVSPTRTNLLRARRRIERVLRGRDLLRRKREALAAELFRLARPAVDARAAIDERVAEAYPRLVEALATHGRDRVRALAWPARAIQVDIRTAQLWGMAVADITERPPIQRPAHERDTAPGTSGPAISDAASEFELLTELLLDAAPREMLLRRLGAALSRTSRQVRGLEQRVAPELEQRIARIRRTLEERQREEHLRLKHILRKRLMEDAKGGARGDAEGAERATKARGLSD